MSAMIFQLQFNLHQMVLMPILLNKHNNQIKQNGVENLWPDGLSPGGLPRPGFIRWCPENYMWAFIIAFPFAFCDKKYWFLPRRDVPFECFDPIVEQMNEKRRNLFKDAIRMLIADETMCPWRPKKSKKGGLPKLIYIPRKPHPFGLLLRNAMEATTCIMTNQEVTKDAEVEDLKEYTNTPSHMPGQGLIPHYVAETMRLCKNSGLGEGDWCSADAYYGGVETVVELKAELGIYSTFVVKNNNKWFPMGPLTRLLSARHGDKRLGHWAVMTTTISDVELMAVAWSWHPDGTPAFYVSSCGTTAPSTEGGHLSQLETGLGYFDTRLVPQPGLIAGTLDLLSIIDEHNKKHSRRELPIYESWPTKHPWFRAVCCLIGQCVVDEFHAFKWKDSDTYQDMSVLDFVDEALMPGSLRTWSRNYAGSLSRQRPGAQQIRQGQRQLVRITDNDGSYNYEPTERDKARGRQTGRNRGKPCWVCKRYSSKYLTTTFCCKDCRTPICLRDRTGENGRTQSCRMEHWNSTLPEIHCDGVKKTGFFPNELKLYE